MIFFSIMLRVTGNAENGCKVTNIFFILATNGTKSAFFSAIMTEIVPMGVLIGLWKR